MVHKLQKKKDILHKMLTQFLMFYVHLFKLYIFFIFLYEQSRMFLHKSGHI